jgi:hypothetical protein
LANAVPATSREPVAAPSNNAATMMVRVMALSPSHAECRLASASSVPNVGAVYIIASNGLVGANCLSVGRTGHRGGSCSEWGVVIVPSQRSVVQYSKISSLRTVWGHSRGFPHVRCSQSRRECRLQKFSRWERIPGDVGSDSDSVARAGNVEVTFCQ